LLAHPLVIGDDRPFVTALLVPDPAHIVLTEQAMYTEHTATTGTGRSG